MEEPINRPDEQNRIVGEPVEYIFCRSDPSIYAEIYFPKKAAYQGAIFDALRNGINEQHVHKYFAKHAPALCAQLRDYPELLNPHQYESSDPPRKCVITLSNACARLAAYKSPFKGYSVYSVDGVFFDGQEPVEEATQVIRLLFRFQSRLKEEARKSGFSSVLGVMIRTALEAGATDFAAPWSKDKRAAFLLRCKSWEPKESKFAEDNFDALSKEVKKWKDDCALFVFGYLVRCFSEKVLLEQLNEDEIWVASFFDLNINVVRRTVETDATGIAALAYWSKFHNDANRIKLPARYKESVEEILQQWSETPPRCAPFKIELGCDSDEQNPPDQLPIRDFFEFPTDDDRYTTILDYACSRISSNSKVLDIGCLAGRFALHFQNLGHQVTGIDVSPGAVWVAKQLGLRHIRQQNVFDILPAPTGSEFDLVLLLGLNIGIGGTLERVRRLLEIIKSVTRKGSLLLMDSSDRTSVPTERARRQVALSKLKNRPVGQMKYTVGVGPFQSGEVDWIHVTPVELDELIGPIGWKRVYTFASTQKPGYWSGVFENA